MAFFTCQKFLDFGSFLRKSHFFDNQEKKNGPQQRAYVNRLVLESLETWSLFFLEHLDILIDFGGFGNHKSVIILGAPAKRGPLRPVDAVHLVRRLQCEDSPRCSSAFLLCPLLFALVIFLNEFECPLTGRVMASHNRSTKLHKVPRPQGGQSDTSITAFSRKSKIPG